MACNFRCQEAHRCFLRPITTFRPFRPVTRSRQPALAQHAHLCVAKASDASSRQSQKPQRKTASRAAGQAHVAGSSAQAHNSSESLTRPTSDESQASIDAKPASAKLGTLWGLLVLAGAYVHHSTCGSVLVEKPDHCCTPLCMPWLAVLLIIACSRATPAGARFPITVMLHIHCCIRMNRYKAVAMSAGLRCQLCCPSSLLICI